MKIILNPSNLLKFETNESYEDDHISCVLDDVCEKIDENKLAVFQVCFEEYDKIFEFSDFKYDFTSIFYELKDLFEFIDNRKKGQFELSFFELNRSVFFYIDDDEFLFLKVKDSNENKFVVTSDRITLQKIKSVILQIMHQFRLILISKFPKAYEIIHSNDYFVLLSNN
ncbi:hypothetical protein V9L05_21700 (plasmid) [Bernardetia sp. Wsw4-3y2]|uniref:hypothetical protein n=1 Tax=Bernardetia sp. Wsw4-3y2 TaxID=3127471 RepID=UPI0030D43975